MAERTPLLPTSNRPPHSHPIFFQVCHSPWRFLPAKALLPIRMFIALYMTTILAFQLYLEIGPKRIGKFSAFEINNISLLLQVIYYWITSYWTLRHILKPNGKSGTGFAGFMEGVFSIPITSDIRSKRRFMFSLFYTAAVTIPMVVTTIFWLVLYRSDPRPGPSSHSYSWSALGEVSQYASKKTFPNKPFKMFVLISINAVNTFIALMEILFLSSVKKQKPFIQHMVGVAFLCLLYYAWTVLGRLITKRYVYKYLDVNYRGPRALVMTYISTMCLAMTMFLVQ